MAYQLYLRVSGIDGPVLSPPAYAKWIKISGYSWGTQPSNAGTGSGERNFRRLDEITVSKEYDKTSPSLSRKCADGDHIDKVQIDVTRLEGKVVTKVREFVFTDVLIINFGISGAGTDNVTFHFAAMAHKEESAEGS